MQHTTPDKLVDHPEGGRFQEVFRAPEVVTTSRGETKSALTHIYFQLDAGEVSKFHRIVSCEVWSLYRGSGLRLYVWQNNARPPEIVTLSAAGNTFCHVVPAGAWQAAEPLDGAVLVGCSVAPGFEFSGFELLDGKSDDARALQTMAPEMERFVG